MPSLYASIDLLLIADLPLSIGIDAYLDVNLIDIPGYQNGVYRHINRDYLRWMRARIELAAKPDSGVPPEALALRQSFFQDCCRQSGLLPSDKPLRSDYTRPSESTAFRFKGNFCMWDNCRAEIQQPEKDFGAIEEFALQMGSKPSDGKKRQKRRGEDDETGEDFESTEDLGDVVDTGKFLGDLGNSADIASGVVDFTPRPPHAYLLCRNIQYPDLYPTRFFAANRIDANYKEFHTHVGEWHKIRNEWKLPDGEKGSDQGIWQVPEWWIAEQSASAVAANPLDELF